GKRVSAHLELSLGAVVGPGEQLRVAGERDVVDRVDRTWRGGIDHAGALVVVDEERFGGARSERLRAAGRDGYWRAGPSVRAAGRARRGADGARPAYRDA